jgi:Prokaryotic RING finger family 1
MMRAAAIHFSLNSVQCPFCRSQAEKMSSLIVCSDCNTFYHRECWQQNNGCSVFGCDGIMNDLKKRRGEPGWLIALRILVFGFIVCSFISPLIEHSFYFELLLIFWTILFMFVAPVLFIIEIACLFLVYGQPELASRYGKLAYHVTSLSGYGIIIFLFFLSMFLLPFMI